MMLDYEELCNSLSMTEIIRLQIKLSTALVRRFEKPMALAFSDIVGSTRCFAKFGDAAGRQLQQRHVDLVHQSIAGRGGRIVDTAGDGAFLCFPGVDQASSSMIEFLRLISQENTNRSREQQLAVRIGLHFGPVLTDGTQVTGDSVNFCSRVAASASPGEIRLTREAFLAFSDLQHRLKCRRLPQVALKGFDRPVDLMVLDWRDRTRFPSSVRFETGEEYILPEQDIISFGRLVDQAGIPANDIVLQCRDENQSLQISRWHFELRRQPDAFVIRAISSAATAINGRPIQKGEEFPLRPGDCVRVGNVLSLHFQAPQIRTDITGGGETVTPCTANAEAAPQSPGAYRSQEPEIPTVKSSPGGDYETRNK